MPSRRDFLAAAGALGGGVPALAAPIAGALPSPPDAARWSSAARAHPQAALAAEFIADARADGLPAGDHYLRWRVRADRMSFTVETEPALLADGHEAAGDGLRISVRHDGAPLTESRLMVWTHEDPVRHVLSLPRIDDANLAALGDRAKPDLRHVLDLIRLAKRHA